MVDINKEATAVCYWTLTETEDVWAPSCCDERWIFPGGGPKLNGMNFCTFCGKELLEEVE
jgi:hypothetical protein